MSRIGKQQLTIPAGVEVTLANNAVTVQGPKGTLVRAVRDEIEITIPDGFIVEAKPNGMEQETEFGYYKIEFNAISTNKILCTRKLIIKTGFYDKSKYESYRKFRETIAKADNSKIVISKT